MHGSRGEIAWKEGIELAAGCWLLAALDWNVWGCFCNEAVWYVERFKPVIGLAFTAIGLAFTARNHWLRICVIESVGDLSHNFAVTEKGHFNLWRIIYDASYFDLGWIINNFAVTLFYIFRSRLQGSSIAHDFAHSRFDLVLCTATHMYHQHSIVYLSLVHASPPTVAYLSSCPRCFGGTTRQPGYWYCSRRYLLLVQNPYDSANLLSIISLLWYQ